MARAFASKPKGWLFMCFLLVAISRTAQAGDVQIDCDKGVSAADCEMLSEVVARILAVAEPVPDYVWPPHIYLRADAEVNAFSFAGSHSFYAAYCKQEGITPRHAPEGRLMTMMIFNSGLLTNIVEGDPHRLSLVVGHELGHLQLRHSEERLGAGETAFVHLAYGRGKEYEADLRGMELALAAGYSYRRILRAFKRIDEDLIKSGREYSSFHALRQDHPSWKERLAHLDKNQATLWTAMSAFENGVLFLTVEQYVAAERAFRSVKEEFPGAYEAWANLGYVLLMQYCDALDPEDVRRFEVGHLLVGGFYRRPLSLEAKVRGIDEELWWDAVGALREALRLNPKLTLAKANLGVAYLLRPAGKDVGQATRYLEEAAVAAEHDDRLDPIMRATVLINAGVAHFAGGEATHSTSQWAQAEAQAEAYVRALGGRTTPPREVETALLYNRALVYANTPGRKGDAVEMLDGYFKRASVASAWWDLAYERYVQLCEELGRTPATKAQLRGRASTALRPLRSVELGDGTGVTLSEPLEEVEQRLGTGQAVPLAGRSRLSRIYYAAQGIELIATDKVIAIALRGENAPALSLQAMGLGVREVKQLRIGMTGDELDGILYNEDYDFRKLTDPNTNYRFYRTLGLAVRVKQGVVVELVVVQLPEATI